MEQTFRIIETIVDNGEFDCGIFESTEDEGVFYASVAEDIYNNPRTELNRFRLKALGTALRMRGYFVPDYALTSYLQCDIAGSPFILLPLEVVEPSTEIRETVH